MQSNFKQFQLCWGRVKPPTVQFIQGQPLTTINSTLNSTLENTFVYQCVRVHLGFKFQDGHSFFFKNLPEFLDILLKMKVAKFSLGLWINQKARFNKRGSLHQQFEILNDGPDTYYANSNC